MKRHLLFVGVFLLLVSAWARAAGPQDKLAQAEDLLAQKHEAEASKLIQQAIVETEALIVSNPEEAGLRDTLGRAYWMQNDLPKAEAAYREAVRLAPQEVRYTGALAGVLEAAGKADEAIATVRKQIELAPNDPHPYGILAGLYFNAGKVEEALRTFKKSTEIDPKYFLGWSNIGQIEQSRGHHAEAVAAFEQTVKINPDDWRAWAKIVQEYQALGKTKERDAARSSLITLHDAGRVDALLFCREQFVEAGQAVMVFEYFELKGDRAVRYAFDLLDKEGRHVAGTISLGSYDMTNAIAHQTGDLPKDQRLFHLDRYGSNSHETYAFFEKEPTYEETRALVIKVLRGEIKKVSSTTVVPATQK